MTANLNLFKATIAAMLLTEGVSDTGCENLNKIQATALELGGTNFDKEEGACYVEIAGPENAQQFIDYLDGEDCVEAYDVTVSGDAVPEDADILDLPEETVFGFAIYLDGEEVTYEGVDVEDDEELDEAIKGWKNAAVDIAKSRAQARSDAQPVRIVRLNNDGKESGMRDAATTFSSREEAEKKVTYWLGLNPGKKMRWNLYIDGKLEGQLGTPLNESTAAFPEGPEVLEETVSIPRAVDGYGIEVPLDEARKRIQVNFTGKKRVKVQCAKGFKYDATAKTCVKIAGDELATRRKASIKALVSRKAGGAALKNRAAIRTKKAMKFRSALGLK